MEARALCAAQQITVSDRRWRKLAALLQVQAASRLAADDADATVSPWDLWVLPYVLAARPAQVPTLRDWFLAGVGQAVPVDVLWLVRATEAFEKQLEIETSAPASSDDDGAGKLALARAIAGPGAHDVGQGLVRMVADQARKRYSGLHLAARGAQVQEVLDRAVAALQGVQATAEAVRTQAHAHAWLPPTWRDAIDAVHRDNVRTLAQLRARLQGVAEGFAELPVDPALAAVEPAAVQILA